MEQTYSEAIRHSWRLVWHNKVMWIFGLLAVLAGEYGLSNFLGRFTFSTSGKVTATLWLLLQKLWQGLGPTEIAELLFLGGVMFLAVAFLVTAAQGALIAASADWFRRKTVPHFGKALKRGTKHAWRLLALLVSQKIVLAVLLVVAFTGVDVLSGLTGAGKSAALIVFTAIVFMAAIIIYSIFIYSASYVVVEEKGIFISLAKGWSLFWRHVTVSVELSLLTVILTLVVAYGVIMSLSVLLFPSAIFTLLSGVSGYSGFIMAGVSISLVLMVLFVALVGAILNALIISSWVYLFMKMHREGIISRMTHFVSKLLGA